jgi:hypothetical protein
VAFVLAATALAKIFSAGGAAQILSRPDPLLLLSTRHLLVLVALIELSVAAYLVAGNSPHDKFRLVLWVSSAFILYRVLLFHLAPGTPCPCLGTSTANLGVSQATADFFLKIILAYMFIGSLFFLLVRGLTMRREPQPLLNDRGEI